MQIILNNASMIPIYEQLVEQVKNLILSGELPENEALPSVRTLAAALKISALTVKKAYDKLEEDGFVVTVHGKGTYVAPTPAYETYSRSETTLMKLSAQDRLCVEVPVDELDILSLMPGMEATVTLDAFKGETFRGVVEKISRRGENSGGNTKFTVTVALDGQPRMLEGMNASVSVVTATHDAAITVPAVALQEISGKTYLYTGYSQKEDKLLNPVQVQTGVSDDQTVEILSGLEAGQVFYYRYAGSITYSFARDL